MFSGPSDSNRQKPTLHKEYIQKDKETRIVKTTSKENNVEGMSPFNFKIIQPWLLRIHCLGRDAGNVGGQNEKRPQDSLTQHTQLSFDEVWRRVHGKMIILPVDDATVTEYH